jgi:hypothetical protein
MMGDMAQAILDGDFCCECGEYIGPGDGFTRICNGCKLRAFASDAIKTAAPGPPRIYCPLCRKGVAGTHGLKCHALDKHRSSLDEIIETIRNS